MLAALRGKMLDLAVERGDGAFTNFLRSAACRRSPAQLDARREGFELLCRFFCLPGEREQVEPLARFMFSSYITVPVYAAFYRWLGYGEQIDAMVAAGRPAIARRPPPRRPGADRGHVHLRHPRGMSERIEAFVAGGVTLPILTPIVPPDRSPSLSTPSADYEAERVVAGGVGEPSVEPRPASR